MEGIFRSYRKAGYARADFFEETPRSTILALQGASEKAQNEFRNVVTGAWLNGRLSGMIDPENYPSLEEMLGEEKQAEPELEPGAEHVGAKLWVMWLNRKRG